MKRTLLNLILFLSFLWSENQTLNMVEAQALFDVSNGATRTELINNYGELISYLETKDEYQIIFPKKINNCTLTPKIRNMMFAVKEKNGDTPDVSVTDLGDYIFISIFIKKNTNNLESIYLEYTLQNKDRIKIKHLEIPINGNLNPDLDVAECYKFHQN